jgi:Mn-dependent DtxR family transcriptional regulator
MDLRRQKKLREDYLAMLWEMHDGYYGADVDNQELCRRIGIDYDKEGTLIAQPLYKEGLVSWEGGFARIALTTKGIREAERIVESRYAEKETRVLEKIYDMSEQNTTKPVFIHLLEAEVGMHNRELSGFCKGLEEQRYIDWTDSYVNITRQGIDAIDSLGKPKPGTGDTYHTNIGPVTGGVHVGPGGVQNTQINNPVFD